MPMPCVQQVSEADSLQSEAKASEREMSSHSLSLVRNSGHRTWVRHSSRKSSATHSYQCVCGIFVRPGNGMAASVWDF